LLDYSKWRFFYIEVLFDNTDFFVERYGKSLFDDAKIDFEYKYAWNKA